MVMLDIIKAERVYDTAFMISSEKFKLIEANGLPLRPH